MGKNIKTAITIKPVVNYKQTTQVGVFCPITKRFLATGVDSNLHVALPLTAEVAMEGGQMFVTVKTPQDLEGLKEKPVLEVRVKPYTCDFDITAARLVSLSKSPDTKVIRSR